MTTNPGQIVRTRARNGGRASVHEANGWCQAYSTGLLSGTGVVQNSVADMNVLVGGSIGKPDVVIAETPQGYRIALDLIGQEPVLLTASETSETMQLIVAYTEDILAQSSDSGTTGSPSSCGLIPVKSDNAEIPDEAAIQKAISEDSGSGGSQAAYAVIAKVLVPMQAKAIESKDIEINEAAVQTSKLAGKASLKILDGSIINGDSFVAENDCLVVWMAEFMRADGADNNATAKLNVTGASGTIWSHKAIQYPAWGRHWVFAAALCRTGDEIKMTTEFSQADGNDKGAVRMIIPTNW